MLPIDVGKNEVLVYHIDTDIDDSHAFALSKLLTSEELQRANNFYFERDRKTYIITRGILRTILGSLIRKNPSELQISYTTYGRPFLISNKNTPDIRFNVSHSHDRALIAITKGRNVGVDIEYIRPLRYEDRISERFFSLKENEALRSLPKNIQHRAFFTCWTRKEAFIKAKGGGLTIPLKSFTVTLIPGEPAELLQTDRNIEKVKRWCFFDLDIGTKYVAAVAVEAQHININYLSW
jgi:4'-phosphopantetheinyl transferase